MKKILIPLFFIPLFSSAQKIGIKFNNPKTFILTPETTFTTDSITIHNINDNCEDAITCTVTYYSLTNKYKTKELVVWSGADYINNKDWTKNQLKQRVKDLLTP